MSDQRLRELERLAETGDPEARTRLEAGRKQIGLCIDCARQPPWQGWINTDHCLPCYLRRVARSLNAATGIPKRLLVDDEVGCGAGRCVCGGCV